MNPHRWLCRLGVHLAYQYFHYAPQGFASDHYVTMHKCLVCGKRLPDGRIPFIPARTSPTA